MSVIIKDMDKADRCADCQLLQTYQEHPFASVEMWCGVTDERIDNMQMVLPTCPIIADHKTESQTMVYPQVDGITPSVIAKTEPQTDLLVTEYPQDGEVNLIGRDKTEAVVMAYDVYKELTEPWADYKKWEAPPKVDLPTGEIPTCVSVLASALEVEIDEEEA